MDAIKSSSLIDIEDITHRHNKQLYLGNAFPRLLTLEATQAQLLNLEATQAQEFTHPQWFQANYEILTYQVKAKFACLEPKWP